MDYLGYIITRDNMYLCIQADIICVYLSMYKGSVFQAPLKRAPSTSDYVIKTIGHFGRHIFQNTGITAQN